MKRSPCHGYPHALRGEACRNGSLAGVAPILSAMLAAMLAGCKSAPTAPDCCQASETRTDSRTVLPPVASTEPPVAAEKFPRFSAQTTDGFFLTEGSLLGPRTIVTFVFASCRVACPRTMRELKFLAEQLAKTDVKFLAFTIDPDRDTPELFEQFARDAGLGAQLDSRRLTLARMSKQATWDLVRTALRGDIQESDRIKYILDDGTEIMHIFHPAKFVLVGSGGEVRRIVESNSREQVKALAASLRVIFSTEVPGDGEKRNAKCEN